MYEDKPYRLWAGDEEGPTGLQCLFWPKCRHCGTKQEFWTAKPLNFSINDGDDVARSHAIDIEVICPKCGYWKPFGVAVSKEHFEKVTEWSQKNFNLKYLKPRRFKNVLL